MLSANLTEEQKKSLQQILTTAEQKRNQKRSNAIEKSGGECLVSYFVYFFSLIAILLFPQKQVSNSLNKQFQRTSTSAARHQTRLMDEHDMIVRKDEKITTLL